MDANPNPRRLFLYESGWRVELKLGSDREFCYTIAPGQDCYHRLADGEIYLVRGEEKVCIPCANRRRLLEYGPTVLRERAVPIDIDDSGAAFDYDVCF